MMRFSHIAAVGILAVSASLFAQEPAAGTSPEAQRIERLEAQIRQLTKRVDELESKLSEVQELKDENKAPEIEHFRGHGANAAALKKITLARNPTREQAADYVDQIIRITSRQNSFSSGDPQVDMLAEAGRSHLDVLLNADDPSGLYVPDAVLLVATGGQKQQVIQAMVKHPNLVRVIGSKGWEKDAKAELIAGLKTEKSYLPDEWIQAVARLNDPATYPLLEQYLAHGLNPSNTYAAIHELEGIDLAEPVAQAWAQAKRNPFQMRDVGMAAVAARYGHADALDWLVDALSGQEWDRDRALQAIESVTDATGDREEIKKWFTANKSRLVWDSEMKKFTVREPKK
jgi:hypothetical protein